MMSTGLTMLKSTNASNIHNVKLVVEYASEITLFFGVVVPILHNAFLGAKKLSIILIEIDDLIVCSNIIPPRNRFYEIIVLVSHYEAGVIKGQISKVW